MQRSYASLIRIAGHRHACPVPRDELPRTAIPYCRQVRHTFGVVLANVTGSFDDALHIVRQLGERGGVTVVNSINPYRIEGQKTAAFEICGRSNSQSLKLESTKSSRLTFEPQEFV